MPIASIVVPAYNVEATLADTLRALFAQTFEDFEILVVIDGATDTTRAVAESFAADPRLRIVAQQNRGLAGARNSGIAAAQGRYIGFCDADDLWLPGKLAAHVAHLEAKPGIGISFSGSAMIDDAGTRTGHRMQPRLTEIAPQHVFKRNPIGNGSALVARADALRAVAYWPDGEQSRAWCFDESFRQSEDIECWLRMVLTTPWRIEGIPGDLTLYRISAGGLSAATEPQLASWERMVKKLRPAAPEFFAAFEPAARAYQFRYLARRSVSSRDGRKALRYCARFLRTSLRPLREEPLKSVSTLGASTLLALVGSAVLGRAEAVLLSTSSQS